MNGRERIRKALNRQQVDRTPYQLIGEHIGYTPPFMKMFKEKTGQDSPGDFFDLDCRGVFLGTTKKNTDFTGYYKDIRDEDIIDEWGVLRRKGSIDYLVQMHHPMTPFDSTAQIDKYEFPDCEALYRFENIKEKVLYYRDRGYATAFFAGSIFEQSWYLRGMDTLLMDFLMNKEMTHHLLEIVTDKLILVAGQAAKLGVDVIVLGDDIAMQENLMMSLDIYNEFLKPRLKKTADAIKEANPDSYVFYHSDGNVEAAIPNLLEAGVEILNPIQPECMDPAEIKKRYGDRLSFWGTFSLQKNLPFGKREDIRNEVRLRIETVGKGGGLVLAPAHVIDDTVPWENVLAFIEACKEFGPLGGTPQY